MARPVSVSIQSEGSLPLRTRWCRCTSSSRDTCWPGTSGRFYTAASFSGPCGPRCRRCRSPSPEIRWVISDKCVIKYHSDSDLFFLQLTKLGLWGTWSWAIKACCVYWITSFSSSRRTLNETPVKSLSFTSDNYDWHSKWLQSLISIERDCAYICTEFKTSQAVMWVTHDLKQLYIIQASNWS